MCVSVSISSSHTIYHSFTCGSLSPCSVPSSVCPPTPQPTRSGPAAPTAAHHPVLPAASSPCPGRGTAVAPLGGHPARGRRRHPRGAAPSRHGASCLGRGRRACARRRRGRRGHGIAAAHGNAANRRDGIVVTQETGVTRLSFDQNTHSHTHQRKWLRSLSPRQSLSFCFFFGLVCSSIYFTKGGG